VVGLLDLGNGLSRVEALGTNLGAVHDGLAPGRFCGDETKNAEKKTVVSPDLAQRPWRKGRLQAMFEMSNEEELVSYFCSLPVEFEGVVELLNSLVGDGVSAVDDPSVRLQEHRRPEVP